MLRVYAYSKGREQVPPGLFEVSNWNATDSTFELPQPGRIKRDAIRLVACTLLMSAKLYSGGLERGWFTHVFIDEAGHAEEPLCLAPLSLLCMPQQTQVVLAGDPEQLGPIVLSTVSKQHGLQVSLLERLMRASPYARIRTSDSSQLPYDPRFVTKLVRNYRSHPEILKGELAAGINRTLARDHQLLLGRLGLGLGSKATTGPCFPW